MAVMQVNPTRLELSRLKKRYAAARRGHKLLKDKRDDMVKRFLDAVRRCFDLRREMEDRIEKMYGGFLLAGALMEEAFLEEALMLPRVRVAAEAGMVDRGGVSSPRFQFTVEAGDEKEARYPYGPAFTVRELDRAMDALYESLPLILQLAQEEKQVQLLAGEIERTRRRVNGLEHVQIPALEETIRSISMKLEETERSNLARLMKVKDLMLSREIQAHRE